MCNSLYKTSKKKFSALLLIFFLAISATAATLPLVLAHDPPQNIPTYAFISAAPNPASVGQPISVFVWLSKFPPTAVGQWGDRWHGFTIDITKPDGTTETQGPFDSDPVGNAYIQFTPNQVGTYNFKFIFPGQTLAGDDPPPTGASGQDYIGDYFEPSSAETAIEVQNTPIPQWQSPALPTDSYWTRPINAQNRDWYQISGNWLMNGMPYDTVENSYGSFQPYSTAPESAHVVWTKELTFGGVVGGQLGTYDYYSGLSYERLFQPPIIMQGRLYYNVLSPPRYGWYCVDLRTGEKIWYQNSTGDVIDGRFYTEQYPDLSFGQIYAYDSPNQHGALAYLWAQDGSTWQMYDAYSGNWLLNVEGVPSGTMVYSSDGSILVYTLNTRTGYLSLWNSSLAVWYKDDFQSNENWMWRPLLSGTVDAANGIEWNTAVPKVAQGSLSINSISSGVIVASTLTQDTFPYTIYARGYSATTGAQLWDTQITTPHERPTWGPATDGVFTLFVRDTMTIRGFDVQTGQQVWETQPMNSAFDMYGGPITAGNGKLYAATFGGNLYCYDMKTGNLQFRFFGGSAGEETPYGEYPYRYDLLLADGKCYVTTSEHSPNSPLFRGEKIDAVDANTGDLIWTMNGWFDHPALADGYLVVDNCYDNQIYCFGKGQTETTVTATPGVGNSITLQGAVTDQSSGAKGTPAISDAYMSEWMEYLYEQQIMPADATGVPVTLFVTDPNGNTQTIQTTSDVMGHYAASWTPTVQGVYTITASFDGSKSYYSSVAETSISVGASTAPSGQVTASPNPSAVTNPGSQLVVPTYIVVAVVLVIIVAVAAALLIRRRS